MIIRTIRSSDEARHPQCLVDPSMEDAGLHDAVCITRCPWLVSNKDRELNECYTCLQKEITICCVFLIDTCTMVIEGIEKRFMVKDLTGHGKTVWKNYANHMFLTVQIEVNL